MAEHLDDSHLIERADSLSTEAFQFLHEKGLLQCFEEAEATEVVGSVATDLMTRRDIDITCLLDPLAMNRLMKIGERIVDRFSVGRITYIDPTITHWHDYTSGLFCGVLIRTAPDVVWNVDIWAYNHHEYVSVLRSHHELAWRLKEIERGLLLRLKSACDQQSHEIYKAALDHGVRTPEELHEYFNQNRPE